MIGPGPRGYGSASAILGAIGEKRREGKKPAFFERKKVPQWSSLVVYNAGSFTVTKSTEVRLKELGVSEATLGEAHLKAGGGKATTFKLVSLQIKDLDDLAEEIDQVLDYDSRLAQILGQDNVRIITSVGVVFDQETTAKFDASIGGETKLSGSTVEVKLDVGAEGSHKVKIADGTIVAYQFARLCWSPDGRLVDLKLDVDGKDECDPKTLEKLGQRVPLMKESIDNINWSISDSGDPDCPERYAGDASRCLDKGNRSCVMEQAIQSAKRNGCSEAYQLTLLTQCHNKSARDSIARAGEAAVCRYLKSR
jgi:hypothetical protein